MDTPLHKKRIVILGAGFAGIHAYKKFHKLFHNTGEASITLINKGDQFIFTPLIHEVAAGSLLPSDVTEPIRTLPQCCLETFIDGTVEGINFDKKEVQVHRSTSDITHGHVPKGDIETVSYDYLVLALGSVTNFYDVPGAKENSIELKTVMNAITLKNTIIESFERASFINDPDERRAALTFIVVGGGPTGVEVAGEISDLVNGELGNAFPNLKELPRVIMIERGERLLRGVDPWFGKRAHDILGRKANVYHMYNSAVKEVKKDGVVTEKGFVHGHTVIWNVGVKARLIPLEYSGEVEFEEKTHRIKVNSTLNLEAYPDVYVVGDQAWVCDKEKRQPYPMRAQFAVREGEVAAKNITHSIRGEELVEFSWRDKGFIVSLGKGGALAGAFGFRFSGFFAWLIYRAAYLIGLISWRARFRTTFEWILGIFTPRNISKL